MGSELRGLEDIDIITYERIWMSYGADGYNMRSQDLKDSHDLECICYVNGEY